MFNSARRWLSKGDNKMSDTNDILKKAAELRGTLSSGFRDEIVKSLYSEAENITNRAVRFEGETSYDLDQRVDRNREPDGDVIWAKS